MRTTRHFSAAVALGALLSVALGVLAQSGGYPTRARFNSIGVGAAPPAGNGGIAVTTVNGIAPSDFARLSQPQTFAAQTVFADAGAFTGSYSTPGAGGLAVFMDANGIGAVPRLGAISLTSAASQTLELWAASVGVSTDGVTRTDITPASATFVVSFDTACSTTPTATFDAQRIGNLVVLRLVAVSGFTCTGDATGFVSTGAPVPAAFRPAASAVLSPVFGVFIDNGLGATGAFYVTSAGNLGVVKCVSGASCTLNSFTASGLRSIDIASPAADPSFSYMLGNP